MFTDVRMSDRPEWRSRLQFFLYTSALVLSPSSLWQFPICWYHHGGVATVVPYVTSMLTIGLPLVCLEISLGQFMQRAGPSAWCVVPLFKGVSLTSMLVVVLKVSTNMTWAAWSAYYLVIILTNQLPSCVIDKMSSHPLSQDFQTGNGSKPRVGSYIEVRLSETWTHSYDSLTHPSHGISHDQTNSSQNWTCLTLLSQFWSQNVLQTSQSITSPGSAVIEIFIATVVVSIFCFVIVMRDIRWSGKIMYVLAPLPLAGFLSIIVWTASSGWNLGPGLYYLLAPNFEMLTRPETWFGNARTTLLTLGVGLNLLPSLASYNKLVNYTIRDSCLVCVLAVLVNVFTSFLLFVLLGEFISDIDVGEDPTLLFTHVPAALMSFQRHAILCFLFFVSITAIIIGTTVVYTESLVSSLVDLSLKLRRWRLAVVTGTVCVCFLISMSMSTQGGIYVFRVVRRVTDGGFLVSLISIMECLIIGALYGGTRFYDNLEVMTGRRPHWWIKFCWTWLTPLILLTTLVYQECVDPLYILELGVDHPHPELAKGLMMLLVTLLLLPTPLVALWVVYSKGGTCAKRIGSALKPDLKPHQVPIRWRLEGNWIKFTNRL